MTVNIVLLISNVLATWGTISNSPVLLLPWLTLYMLAMLFILCLLIYLIVLLEEAWFKVQLTRQDRTGRIWAEG